ncbi:MAG: DUF2937 family protein [Pseudomonadota bacterium]
MGHSLRDQQTVRDKGMLGRGIALILGLVGVAAGSQAPNFTAHFMQNLEGRIDELVRVVDDINADRAQLGFTRSMAKAACREAPTAIILQDCNRAEETLVRFDTLQDIKAKLDAATGWERPIILAKSVMEDPNIRQIAENAQKEFDPAMPATMEGAGYAAGTGGGLWAVGRLLMGILGAPFRRRDY